MSKDEWRQYYNGLTTPHGPGGLARRTFLQGALAAGALGATGMQLLRSAPSASALGPNERILVVVLFGGGNDGFSMVIPAEDGRYIDARGSLALSPEESIPLSGGLYWNGELPGIAARYQAGDVAVVQGIGDPADDRSHFSSMARWMRGGAEAQPFGFTGWVGRWLDGANAGDFAGIAVGDAGVPLHMKGDISKVTSLSSYGNLYGANVEPYEIPTIDAALEIAANGAGGVWPDAAAQTMADAIGAASAISPIYTDELPEDGIQRDMALAAETINLDVGARVLTVSFGSFDTHEAHRFEQQTLMAAFDAAVAEFFSRLNPTFADRVSIMTFSEFGRSWTYNDSAGIDHGTASNALVIGAGVQGGLYGAQPDFSSFDAEGDVESTVDFRSLYGTVVDDWLDGDSQQIIGGSYENLGIFSTGPVGTAGDVNCDDQVGLDDALMLEQYNAGMRSAADSCDVMDPITQIRLSAADANGDGTVGAADVQTVLDRLTLGGS